MPQHRDEPDAGSVWPLRRWRPVYRIAPLVCVLAAGGILSLFWGGRLFRLEDFLRTVLTARELADRSDMLFLIGFAAVYVLAIAFSLPVALFFTVSGGFLFGWMAGGLVGIFAKTAGSFILFLIARHGFADVAGRWLGGRIAGLETRMRSDSFVYMLFMRLQPVVPFFLVNLAAALFAVRGRVFVLATGLGIAPAAFIFSFSGASLADLVERNREAFDLCMRRDPAACDSVFSAATFWSPQIFAAFVLLALLALSPLPIRRGMEYFRRKRISARP